MPELIPADPGTPEPGWYRLGARGLEKIADLADEPADVTELVKIETGGQALSQDGLW